MAPPAAGNRRSRPAAARPAPAGTGQRGGESDPTVRSSTRLQVYHCLIRWLRLRGIAVGCHRRHHHPGCDARLALYHHGFARVEPVTNPLLAVDHDGGVHLPWLNPLVAADHIQITTF